MNLKEQIANLRDRLNRLITEERNSSDVYELSIELDKLITLFYLSKEEKIEN